MLGNGGQLRCPGDIIDAGIISMILKDYYNVFIGKARREKQK